MGTIFRGWARSASGERVGGMACLEDGISNYRSTGAVLAVAENAVPKLVMKSVVILSVVGARQLLRQVIGMLEVRGREVTVGQFEGQTNEGQPEFRNVQDFFCGQASAPRPLRNSASLPCPRTDHVAIWVANQPEWVLVEFGAALAGLTLVTVNGVRPKRASRRHLSWSVKCFEC